MLGEKHKNKNNYYHSFKTRFRSQLESKVWVTDQKSQPRLTRVNIRIKVIIIMVLRLNSRVD